MDAPASSLPSLLRVYAPIWLGWSLAGVALVGAVRALVDVPVAMVGACIVGLLLVVFAPPIHSAQLWFDRRHGAEGGSVRRVVLTFLAIAALVGVAYVHYFLDGFC